MLFHVIKHYEIIKGVVDCFFLSLIVFMGCNLTCLNASFVKKRIIFHTIYIYFTPFYAPSLIEALIISCFYDAPPSFEGQIIEQKIRRGPSLSRSINCICINYYKFIFTQATKVNQRLWAVQWFLFFLWFTSMTDFSRFYFKSSAISLKSDARLRSNTYPIFSKLVLN